MLDPLTDDIVAMVDELFETHRATENKTVRRLVYADILEL